MSDDKCTGDTCRSPNHLPIECRPPANQAEKGLDTRDRAHRKADRIDYWFDWCRSHGFSIDGASDMSLKIANSIEAEIDAATLAERKACGDAIREFHKKFKCGDETCSCDDLARLIDSRGGVDAH